MYLVLLVGSSDSSIKYLLIHIKFTVFIITTNAQGIFRRWCDRTGPVCTVAMDNGRERHEFSEWCDLENTNLRSDFHPGIKWFHQLRRIFFFIIVLVAGYACVSLQTCPTNGTLLCDASACSGPRGIRVRAERYSPRIPIFQSKRVFSSLCELCYTNCYGYAKESNYIRKY